MASYHPFSLLSLLSLSLISLFPPSSSGTPLNSSCGGGRISPGDTKFNENLESLVASLYSSAPITGFASQTSGETPDRLYGLALCRGDVSPDRCRTCLGSALTDVKSVCPGFEEAVIFYELCMIRYSSDNFFGTSSSNLFIIRTGHVSNVTALNHWRGSWLPQLATRGASSKRRFAADVSNSTESDKWYAMVQCTRDLTPETCNACLRETIEYLRECCGKGGAAVYGGSCFIRYDGYQFFNVTFIEENEANRKSSVTIAPAIAGWFVFFALI